MKKGRLFGVISFSILACLFACGSSDNTSGTGTSAENNFLPGFTPPAPKTDEMQIASPIVEFDEYSDTTLCTYLANPFATAIDVIGMTSDQSHYGHHIVVYDVGQAGTPGDTHKCTDDDMTRARFLGGGGEGKPTFDIPEGLAFRLKPGGRILVQTHWINPTGKKERGQAAVTLRFSSPSADRQLVQTFNVFDTKFQIPARGKFDHVTDCTFKKDLSFFVLTGHAHEWGTRVVIEKISGAESKVLFDHPWKPEYNTDPPRLSYRKEAPLVFHKGDTLRLKCEWTNTTDKMLRFPQEMCVAFGMYFPATEDIDCGDGTWDGPEDATSTSAP